MPRLWTLAEIAILVREYPERHAHEVAAMLGVDVKRVWNKACQMKLGKSEGYWQREKARLSELAKSNAGLIERQMKPGEKPWNAGKSYMPGGNVKAGWFRKGQISKRWDQEQYAVGALRLDCKGELQIKFGNSNWKSMARYAWFLKTGRWPPAGYVVWRKNGDHFDVQDENLELITRAQAMKRNSFWEKYPHDVARLVQLKGAITRQVNRIGEQHERHHQ